MCLSKSSVGNTLFSTLFSPLIFYWLKSCWVSHFGNGFH